MAWSISGTVWARPSRTRCRRKTSSKRSHQTTHSIRRQCHIPTYEPGRWSQGVARGPKIRTHQTKATGDTVKNGANAKLRWLRQGRRKIQGVQAKPGRCSRNIQSGWHPECREEAECQFDRSDTFSLLEFPPAEAPNRDQPEA